MSVERESDGWNPQQGTMHSTSDLKDLRKRTSLPQSTEVGASIIGRGPRWFPRSIIILMVSEGGRAARYKEEVREEVEENKEREGGVKPINKRKEGEKKGAIILPTRECGVQSWKDMDGGWCE